MDPHRLLTISSGSSSHWQIQSPVQSTSRSYGVQFLPRLEQIAGMPPSEKPNSQESKLSMRGSSSQGVFNGQGNSWIRHWKLRNLQMTWFGFSVARLRQPLTVWQWTTCSKQQRQTPPNPSFIQVLKIGFQTDSDHPVLVLEGALFRTLSKSIMLHAGHIPTVEKEPGLYFISSD